MMTRPRYPVVEGIFRTPGDHSVRMAYREGTNDWNTLVASLNEDEYGLPRGMSGVAVDVGGYLGSVGIALAIDNPELQVTIIEPVPPNAELIRQNIALNHLEDRVTLIEGAVGGPDDTEVSVWYGYRGSETLEHHAFVGNSTLAYDHAGEAPHDTVTYAPVTLADLGPIDYLKIDCEGGEWSILDGVAGIPTIVGEAHAVRGHKGSDIMAMLPGYDVSLSYPAGVESRDGTCGFRATLR